MTDPRKRITLHLARAEDAAPKSARPPYSVVKQAILKWRVPGVPKKVWRKNVKSWLVMNEWLGDKHILRKGSPAKWGRAGEPEVAQLRSPRRLGERT